MTDADSGVYLLVLEAPQPVLVRVGAWGELRLEAARYGYVGSARRGLAARLARHCRRDKPLRWHVDYLRDVVEPVGALVWPWRAGRECRLAAALAATGLGRSAAARFGASDCGCGGHLYLLAVADLGILAEGLGRALRTGPGAIRRALPPTAP